MTGNMYICTYVMKNANKIIIFIKMHNHRKYVIPQRKIIVMFTTYIDINIRKI